MNRPVDDDDGRDFVYREMMERWQSEVRIIPEPPIEHFANAENFMKQVRLLSQFMGATAENNRGVSFIDEFEKLINAFELVRCDGKWDDDRLRGYWPDVDKTSVNMALATVKGLSRDGTMSLREATARAVARHGIRGNSFEAARKRIERAYRALTHAVGHPPINEVQ